MDLKASIGSKSEEEGKISSWLLILWKHEYSSKWSKRELKRWEIASHLRIESDIFQDKIKGY